VGEAHCDSILAAGTCKRTETGGWHQDGRATVPGHQSEGDKERSNPGSLTHFASPGAARWPEWAGRFIF